MKARELVTSMPRSCSTCRWQTVSLRCQGSVREEHRFSYILATDDPTHEISAAWGVKEQLRRVLACTTLTAARAERARFNQYVTWADAWNEGLSAGRVPVRPSGR